MPSRHLNELLFAPSEKGGHGASLLDRACWLLLETLPRAYLARSTPRTNEAASQFRNKFPTQRDRDPDGKIRFSVAGSRSAHARRQNRMKTSLSSCSRANRMLMLRPVPSVAARCSRGTEFPCTEDYAAMRQDGDPRALNKPYIEPLLRTLFLSVPAAADVPDRELSPVFPPIMTCNFELKPQENGLRVKWLRSQLDFETP